VIFLQVNDVVEREPAADGLPAPRLAVLYVMHPDRLVTIDLTDPRAFPVCQSAEEIEEELTAGRAKLLDPVVPAASLRPVLSDKELAARDRRWKVIAGSVEDEPRIYEAVGRAAMLRALVEEGHCRNTIINWWQLYWRGGKTRNALVGNWSKCGAKSVERAGGAVKLGRPRVFGAETGINMNRDLRNVARAVMLREWRKNPKMKLASAYESFCRQAFYEAVYLDGKKDPVWELRPQYRRTGPATERQFSYYFHRYVDSMRLQREKRTPRIFDMNERGLAGSPTAETRGPGSRYLIDATIMDVYVRSRINRKRIVGRPVLYVVMDVWSRLIVGIYVGIENASWRCAAMALANVLEDKVEFCRRYGVEIDPHEWPNAGICGALLGDNGEVASKIVASIVRHVNMKVETHGPYRADLKGLLENVFQVLSVRIGDYIPGYVHPDFRERGAEDYRLEAVLDIEEITVIVILAVLHRNNNVRLENYDRDVGMPAAEVAPFASDLWRWGIANRSGRFIQVPPQLFRFRMMEEATAVVDAHGLRFRGAWYLSDEMIARGWLEQGRRKPFRVTISHDPREAGAVLLHMEGTRFGFEACAISSARSRIYDGMSEWEVNLEEADRKEALARGATRELSSSINTTAWTKRIVANAAERTGSSQGMSRAEQLRGIVQNRAEERQRQQVEDAAVFAPEPQCSTGPVAALPAPAEEVGDDDYSVSIFDIAGG
jgi:hypothetical protein